MKHSRRDFIQSLICAAFACGAWTGAVRPYRWLEDVIPAELPWGICRWNGNAGNGKVGDSRNWDNGKMPASSHLIDIGQKTYRPGAIRAN